MNRLNLLLLFMFLTICSFAQEEQEKATIKFSGHIRYEAYYDSYASVFTRQGDIYLYPSRQNLKNGVDLNEYGQLNMLAAQSRLRANISGPGAFGAKVSGLVEVDFLGTKEEYVQLPRIRHMMMQLKWEQASLIMGYTWHPVFVTECFPDVLGMGAALPFNPLNRAPQIKANYALTPELVIEGAVLSHQDFASQGDSEAQKKAILPDFHGSVKYKTEAITAGLVGGLRFLKLRNYLADASKTKVMITNWDLAAFAKVKAGNLTAKVYGIYGTNLSTYVMLGGYGTLTSTDPTAANYKADYEYSSIKTLSGWAEATYTEGAFGVGLFGGYTSNVGITGNEYYPILNATRGDNIKNIIRISPRATYTSGKITLGVEYMFTSAVYMNFDNKYKVVTKDDAVANNRVYFSATYTF